MPDGMSEIFHRSLLANKCNCLKVDEISEAEKLCAMLCKAGVTDAVYSTDSDSIPLGTPVIIRKFENHEVEIYLNKEIREYLKLTQDRILDLSILLGGDFNERTDRRGPVRAMQLVTVPSFKIEDYEAKHGKDAVRVDICRKFLSVSDDDLKLIKDFHIA